MKTLAMYAVVELDFAATSGPTNPYATLFLDVAFRSPSGRVLNVAGFWEDARHWKARFAPDEIGQWTWRSAGNDPGLSGGTGAFEVGNAASDTAWRQHGPLSIHTSGRGFAHADGTPVFWLADTAWAAPAHATKDEWRDYVAHRARQGFNVVHVNALPQWDASGPALRQPFAKHAGRDDLTQPNPEYFRFLDDVVRTAADAGLISAMVILWFENTPADNEDWTVIVPRRGPFTEDTAGLFARFLTARYEAFGTTWIISGDSGFAAPASVALYDIAAKTVRATAVRPPIMTAHLNGGTPPPLALNARGWLDYHMFQSCHFSDSARRAQHYAAEARMFLPRRPVLNGEPCYDGLRQMDQPALADRRFDRADVRRVCWVSVLSGASAGLTYGAHGIWPWHRDGQDYGPIHYGSPLDWRQALMLDSAEDVVRLRGFFSRLPWWEIEPANGIEAVSGTLLATARTNQDDFVFAYVGEPSRLRLPLALAISRYGAWFDPASGTWAEARIDETRDGWFVEPSRMGGDAVLELRSERHATPGQISVQRNVKNA